MPLTSLKKNKDLDNLKNGEVYLGNEIFTSLSTKISATKKHLSAQIQALNNNIQDLEQLDFSNPDFEETLKRLQHDLSCAEKEQQLIYQMSTEISKMKIGSIALLNQITVCSKIRIYGPKTNYDVLSGIKLSNEKLDDIDRMLINLYTKKCIPQENSNKNFEKVEKK